jgi:putative oxidoreductase
LGREKALTEVTRWLLQGKQQLQKFRRVYRAEKGVSTMSTLTHDGTMDRPAAHALTAADWGLLILRLVLGIIFFAHGAQKVLGWFGGSGLAVTVQFMGRSGIPAPLAYLAAFTEFLGGTAVLIGLLARLASLGLAVNMLVAIFKVHLPNGLFAPKGFEFPLALLAIALALVLMGPGRIALADLEGRLLHKEKTG